MGGWGARLGTLLGLRLLPFWVGDGAMAVLLALSWSDPTLLGGGMADDLPALIVLEFLALHATPFIWGVRQKKLPKATLLLYVPFVLAVGRFLGTPFLIGLFLWHLAAAAWADARSEAHVNVDVVRYAVVTVGFIVLVFALSWVPIPTFFYAFLTTYFSLRAVWHIVWWHWERTGELARMGRASVG